ncbi:multiheme c-type cytochrome [Thalassobaculum salexigens]|uniref:multiheme c-type cytochrome n=1 Tax=Thalassobaculum salexigens TaxID=455360 RepID=UPI00248DBBD7|nr:multiheme c-type cytochrome [Thalassobaculum salexigens]
MKKNGLHRDLIVAVSALPLAICLLVSAAEADTTVGAQSLQRIAEHLAAADDDLLLQPSAGDQTPPAQTDDLLLQPTPTQSDDLLLPSAPAQSDDLLVQPSAKDDLLLTPAPDVVSPSVAPAIGAPIPTETPPDAAGTTSAGSTSGAAAEHEKLFAENRFPAATTCATCHPKQYEEWSASQHAYAQLSPVFLTMQAAINAKTSGTNGDFCVRCHSPVGMNLEESVYVSNFDRHPTSREGVTCITCHRIDRNYGKISGRLAIVEGDLYEPVFGPKGDEELNRVLDEPETYRVSTDRSAPGRAIHTEVERFFPLVTPGFCGTCHDVTLVNGFRLEEAFAEYHQSPASQAGVTCQDCHMGKEQGVASGYEEGPAAIVGGEPTRTRKLASHFFAGPDHSILHPGLFPLNVKAQSFKTMREWMTFDDAAGWGTDAFENAAPRDYPFPEAWRSIDDRYDGRKIVEAQKKRLAKADERRLEVLRNGLALDEIRITSAAPGDLSFSATVRNITDGHSVPTGFDAERLMFLDVTVTNADGAVVYRSGDRDPNGDLRDTHSAYVHAGELPLDEDLFNLQSKFLVRLLRGGEREQVLPINTSQGVLPFVRPEALPTTIYGRPRTARKHKQTIDPLGQRTAEYAVPAEALTGSGPYAISVKLKAQMVPVNLILAIQDIGFDYGMSPRQVADAVVDGTLTIAERETVVTLGGQNRAEVQ